MKAMILAAGLGTRLRPLTQDYPKALIRLAGRPLLQIALEVCTRAGIREIAVNAHHHADQISAFLGRWPKPDDVKLHLSLEPELLNTGGGIKRMAALAGYEGPVLVHNVDVVSNIDLRRLGQNHCDSGADVTLATLSCQSERALLFDGRDQLVGYCTRGQRVLTRAEPQKPVRELEFCGIQVIDPLLFLSRPEDVFSSVDLYLRAAGEGADVRSFSADGRYWLDLGSPERLRRAQEDIRRRCVRLP
jgi:NDP-sugar pyrophosphorylase family protein